MAGPLGGTGRVACRLGPCGTQVKHVTVPGAPWEAKEVAAGLRVSLRAPFWGLDGGGNWGESALSADHNRFPNLATGG